MLRRMSQALRRLDWTAISVEFVLLVLGVFLGIQVANWNAERETRQQSELFTARLKGDLHRESRRRDFQVRYYEEVRTTAEAAAAALDGSKPSSDVALLVNAYRAPQFLQTPSQRATYDELVSTGSIGLIKDRRLVALAISNYGNTDAEALLLQRDESPYRALFRESIPYEMQRALARKCGDRLTSDQESDLLAYPCQPALEASAIGAAAGALRADPQALRLLRRRLADIDSFLSDITRNNRRLKEGLAAISKDSP